MDRTKTIAAVTALAAMCGCAQSGHVVKVGSKNFTEQVVLGEIIAQQVEHRLGVRVDRSLNLGGTLLAHQALMNGQIDLYPEYTGTALTSILKDPTNTDTAAVLARVKSEYARRFQLEWLDPLGIDNGFAMVVSSKNLYLNKLSDVAMDARPWTLGVGYEFEQRPDGLAALRKTYGLRFPNVRTMDLGLLYKALQEGQVNIIAANATDGLLSKGEFKVLPDDQHAFPPYQVSIVARQDALQKIPGLSDALNQLSGKLTNDKMRELNFQVDGQHMPVAQVAAEFLQQAQLH
jgi:glycine betaine/choline ABC-type transport system substrate-binding protein